MLKFVIPISSLVSGAFSGSCSDTDFEQIYYGENSSYGYYLAMNCFTNSTQPVSLRDAKSCFATYFPVSISDGCYQCVIDKEAAYDNCYYSVCTENGDTSAACSACYETFRSDYFGDGGCMDSTAWFQTQKNQTDPRDVVLPDTTRVSPVLPTPMTGEEISTACADSDFLTYWKQTKLAALLSIDNCITLKYATQDINSTDILECYGDNDSTPLSVGCRECLAYGLNVDANCGAFCTSDPNGEECSTTCPSLYQTLADNHACIGFDTDPKVLALFRSSVTPISGKNSALRPSITSLLSLIAIAVVVAL